MTRYIKYIVAIMALACMLLIVGCNQREDQHKGEIDDPFISWKVAKFYTEEEIRAFGASDKAPKNFVDYSAVSMIGELVQMEYSYYYNDKPYTCYDYVLVDKNGYKIRIKVSHDGDYMDRLGEELVTEAEKINMTSMHGPVATKESKWIKRGHVGYLYQFQNLQIVSWMVGDDIELKLHIGDPYPMDGEDTFMRRLLSFSEEEALTAVNELEAKIPAHWGGSRWLIPTGIGLVVVALGATGFVVWKKKKRKATTNKPDNSATETQPQSVDIPE